MSARFNTNASYQHPAMTPVLLKVFAAEAVLSPLYDLSPERVSENGWFGVNSRDVELSRALNADICCAYLWSLLCLSCRSSCPRQMQQGCHMIQRFLCLCGM